MQAQKCHVIKNSQENLSNLHIKASRNRMIPQTKNEWSDGNIAGWPSSHSAIWGKSRSERPKSRSKWPKYWVLDKSSGKFYIPTFYHKIFLNFLSLKLSASMILKLIIFSFKFQDFVAQAQRQLVEAQNSEAQLRKSIQDQQKQLAKMTDVARNLQALVCQATGKKTPYIPPHKNSVRGGTVGKRRRGKGKYHPKTKRGRDIYIFQQSNRGGWRRQTIVPPKANKILFCFSLNSCTCLIISCLFSCIVSSKKVEILDHRCFSKKEKKEEALKHKGKGYPLSSSPIHIQSAGDVVTDAKCFLINVTSNTSTIFRNLVDIFADCPEIVPVLAVFPSVRGEARPPA